jgi:hypothetical protein
VGQLTGILRTTDGGANWNPGGDELDGLDLAGVAARGPRIVVASRSNGDSTAGIWLSTDSGASFAQLSGADPPAGCDRLPTVSARALVGDPKVPKHLYAAFATSDGTTAGTSGSVYRSLDTGNCWTKVASGTFGGAASSSVFLGVTNVRLAMRRNGSNDVVYAAINANTSGDRHDTHVVGLFRSGDNGDTWQALDNDADLETIGEGFLAIAADPTHANHVFIAGDANDSPGGIAVCDATQPAGHQCSRILSTTDQPHGDSRSLAFDAAGDLIYTSDGGAFEASLVDVPSHGKQWKWRSLNGDLSTIEAYSCVWDHLENQALCGTQDNGTVEQATASKPWDHVQDGDGGMVAVTYPVVLDSVRYRSQQHLGGFTRESCLFGFACVNASPALLVTAKGKSLRDVEEDTKPGDLLPLITPLAVGLDASSCMAIGGSSSIYESIDAGESLAEVSGFSGTPTTAIAYGPGLTCDKTTKPALYASSEDGVFLRTPSASTLAKTAYPVDADHPPRRLAIDPANWKSAWVVDSKTVQHTPSASAPSSAAGSTWDDVTADLGDAGAKNFHSVAYIPDTGGSAVVVGADNGLFAADLARPDHWFQLTGDLPNAAVLDLDYDALDAVLLIGTLGRGAWSMSVHSPTTITYTGPTHGETNDSITLSAKLKNGAGLSTEGMTLTFKIGSKNCHAGTDSNGVATCSLAPAAKPSPTTVTVTSSGGEPVLSPAKTSQPFTIDKDETKLTYTGPANAHQHTSVQLTATLVDPSGGAGWSGKTVTFKIGTSDTCSGKTGTNGIAKCSLTLSSSPGAKTVKVTFAGDDYIAASSASAAFVVESP